MGWCHLSISGVLWHLKIKCLIQAQGQIGSGLCVFCHGGPFVVSFWLQDNSYSLHSLWVLKDVQGTHLCSCGEFHGGQIRSYWGRSKGFEQVVNQNSRSFSSG